MIPAWVRPEGRSSPTVRLLDASTKLTIVVPCFNEEDVLPLLWERLQHALDEWGMTSEVLLIDDGSTDRTWEILSDFHRRDPRWKTLRFARNFGHQIALRAGLQYASGDIVAVLDADLQDPPEILPRFFDRWREGYDVIFGVRATRREGPFKRWAYHWFYRILATLAEDDIPRDAGDFCVMDGRIVELIRRMPERRPFIRGLRSWVGFRQCAIPYDRCDRAAGSPKYTFTRLLTLAMDGILSSSVVPLRFATMFGAGVSLLAFLGALLTLLLRVFASYLAPFGIQPVPGTATLLMAIFFLGGVQLLCLGVSGEYLGRIYENVKARPFWTVQESLGIDPSLELERLGVRGIGERDSSTPSERR